MITATNPVTGRTFYDVPAAGAQAMRALGWEVEGDDTPPGLAPVADPAPAAVSEESEETAEQDPLAEPAEKVEKVEKAPAKSGVSKRGKLAQTK